MTLVSVVSAYYNEADVLAEFRRRVAAAMESLGVDYELVLVDDHSSDASAPMARGWAETDSHVHYLRLSRNCGPHAALAAGLARARGDCAVMMASDLQSPPEAIATLVATWREGYEIVWGARSERLEDERWLSRLLARGFYWLMRKLALPDTPAYGAEMALVDRRAIEVYNAIPEKHTNLASMLLWIGFRQTTIPCLPGKRGGGKSKWNLSRKLKLLVDSLVSFSYAPIRLASLLGVVVSVLGFLYALIVMINSLAGSPIEGWSSTVIVVLVLGGFQLLVLGILGEYIWRTFDEARGRPRYVIEAEWFRGADASAVSRGGTGEAVRDEDLAAAGRRTSDSTFTGPVPGSGR